MIVEQRDVWPDGTEARALFDETMTYRYLLERDWHDVERVPMFDGARPVSIDFHGSMRTVTFVMLNPSTADALKNDRTVARCMDFAKRWGFKRLRVVNLFALRSTFPGVLKTHPEPTGGIDNDHHIIAAARESEKVIAAWGTHGVNGGRRDLAVVKLLREFGHVHGDKLQALRITKDGHPEHPLYIPAATEPIPFLL